MLPHLDFLTVLETGFDAAFLAAEAASSFLEAALETTAAFSDFLAAGLSLEEPAPDFGSTMPVAAPALLPVLVAASAFLVARGAFLGAAPVSSSVGAALQRLAGLGSGGTGFGGFFRPVTSVKVETTRLTVAASGLGISRQIAGDIQEQHDHGTYEL